MFWDRTPFDSRWAVAVAWGIVVAGAACLTDAVLNIVRIMTLPKGELSRSADWCVCWVGTMAGRVLISSDVRDGGGDRDTTRQERRTGSATARIRRPTGSERCQWAAIIASALIVIAGIVYAVLNPWKGDSSGGSTSSTTAFPLPSFPTLGSPPDFSTTTSTTASEPTTASAGSAHGSVVVDGETLYTGDYVSCGSWHGGTAVNIMVGHSESGGAMAVVSKGDAPQVESVALFHVEGETFVYDPSIEGAGGPVYAVKSGLLHNHRNSNQPEIGLKTL